MGFIDLLHIKRFHEAKESTSVQGSVQALGWKNEQSQQERFRILSEIADLTGSTILDLGCGYGDLKVFLDQKFKNISYKGIDQMESFLDAAIERFEYDFNAKFYLCDFTVAQLPTADYILASGALSYVNQNPEFIFEIIRKMFEACGKGIGFNLLNHTPEGQLILRGYKETEILGFCNSLSKDVGFKADYLSEDFTVFVYK